MDKKTLDKKKFLLFAIIAGVAGIVIGGIFVISNLMHLYHWIYFEIKNSLYSNYRLIMGFSTIFCYNGP